MFVMNFSMKMNACSRNLHTFLLLHSGSCFLSGIVALSFFVCVAISYSISFFISFFVFFSHASFAASPCPSVPLPVRSFICFSSCCLSFRVSVGMFTCLSCCLFFFLSIRPSVCLCQYVCMSFGLSVTDFYVSLYVGMAKRADCFPMFYCYLSIFLFIYFSSLLPSIFRPVPFHPSFSFPSLCYASIPVSYIPLSIIPFPSLLASSLPISSLLCPTVYFPSFPFSPLCLPLCIPSFPSTTYLFLQHKSHLNFATRGPGGKQHISTSSLLRFPFAPFLSPCSRWFAE